MVSNNSAEDVLGKNELRNVLTDEDKNFLFKNSETMTVKEIAESLRLKPETIWNFLSYHRLNYKRIRQHRRTSLTPREKEIMELVAEGLGNEEITAKLCITYTTLKTHLSNIYQKYGLFSSNAKDKSAMRVRAVLQFQKGDCKQKEEL